MMTVAMIHATHQAIEPMEQAFHRLAPDIQLRSYVNEGMLVSVNRHGSVHKEDLRTFTKLIFAAMESDADAILICCSIFCSYVPLMQNFTDKPIIAINTPMLEKAASIGGKIGIISTTPTSGPHTQQQIEALASKPLIFCHEIVPDAISALQRDDARTHDQIIAQAALRLQQKHCSCILLSQITMARAKSVIPESNIPVLTSPEEGVLAIKALLSKQPALR